MANKKPVRGQCYENNFRYLMDRNSRGESLRTWRLCHGVAIGKGPISGVPFGHSWLEYKGENGPRVYDATYDKDVPTSIYYMTGEIGTVIKYTYDHACRMATRTGTYGPWHPAIQRASHKGRRRNG